MDIAGLWANLGNEIWNLGKNRIGLAIIILAILSIIVAIKTKK